MSTLLLHHYADSPFSEKIRALLGYKNLGWGGIEIPTIMPKPDLMALTGGYRKTPVLQIGADVYCDSRLITRVIEDHSPEKTIYPEEFEGTAFLLSEWIDTTLFATCVALVFSPAGIAKFLSSRTKEETQAFMADRAKLTEGSKSSLGGLSPEIAEASLLQYLAGLDRQLKAAGPYLLGASATTADFSLFHCLWFLRENPGLSPLLEPHRSVIAWYDHIQSFGHGDVSILAGEEAVKIAEEATPATITAKASLSSDSFALGQSVAVVPTDYGLVPVIGELLRADSERITIGRDDARAGHVHVHFPRVGFEIKAPAV